MIGKVFVLLVSASLTLCGCNKGKQEQPKYDEQGIKTAQTEFVEKGNQSVQNVNKRDAGFISNRSSEVTLTLSCFGVVNMDEPDVLPRTDETSRKDYTVIEQLNRGEVFLLQTGTKGIMMTDTGSKLLVRFQIGELWIWKSATK